MAATLKERAASQGQSLSAYVASQLSAIATRPTNEEVVERLRRRQRDDSPSRSEILDQLRTSRQ